SGLAVIPDWRWSARRKPLPTKWRRGWERKAPTAFPRWFPICLAGSTVFSGGGVRDFKGAGLFGAIFNGATFRTSFDFPVREIVFLRTEVRFRRELQRARFT